MRLLRLTGLRFPAPRRPVARPAAGAARRRARAALGFAPLALAACLTAPWAVADAADPGRLDPQYLLRRGLLRQLLADRPGCRLGVVLGSSRMVRGFGPEQLPPDGRGTVWFNLAHTGAGPGFNRVLLARALAEGVRPAVVVVEVMPGFATRENPRLVAPYLSAREAVAAADYLPADGLAWQFARYRYFRPVSLRALARPDEAVAPAGPLGGLLGPGEEVSPAVRAARRADQLGLYGPLARGVELSPGAARALRDTLADCRAHGAAAVLLLPPEDREFRSWYDPDRWRRFEAGVADAAREHGARVVDARDWLPDEAFSDGHHITGAAAAGFSARLVQAADPR